MATSRILALSTLRRSFLAQKSTLKAQQQSLRWETTSSVGSIKQQPPQVKLGLLKAFVVVVPFLYIGATISKEGAAFLEENDIFVPEDDDD
ncbi:hypothetical protein BSL78_18725 [Apostichopus japonicus]|uniref:Essential MCU regulator, mitochondrial n=1 Tax=Stichopus japonicus TaxID=307972 RepID=A0A2G8K8R3_STIJA|nr:hypothetical protein BSL78_18725 [Apostichopus japonicus]